MAVIGLGNPMAGGVPHPAPIPATEDTPSNSPESKTKAKEDGLFDFWSDRGPVAATAVGLGVGLSIGRKALDIGRIQFAAPHAIRTNRYKQWLAANAIQHAVAPVVPMSGGWWGKTFNLQNRLTPLAFALGLFVMVPNMKEGIDDEGLEGLVTTRPGRTGLFQGLTSALSIGTLAIAAAPGWRGGIRGMDAAMNQAIWRAKWPLVATHASIAPLVPLNEMKAFDGWDSGDDRTVAESMRDSSEQMGKAGGKSSPYVGVAMALAGSVSLYAGFRAGKALPMAVGGAATLLGGTLGVRALID